MGQELKAVTFAEDKPCVFVLGTRQGGLIKAW